MGTRRRKKGYIRIHRKKWDKPEHVSYLVGIIKKFLKPPLLDAGCGYGRIMKHVDKVIGIDVSKYMVREAKKLGKPVFQRQITDTKFPDKSFNGVYSIDVFQHLKEEDQIKSLIEFNRLLKDKGRIFITVPYFFTQESLVWELKRIFYRLTGKLTVITARNFTKKRIYSLISKSGFKIIHNELRENSLNIVAEKVKDMNLKKMKKICSQNI